MVRHPVGWSDCGESLTCAMYNDMKPNNATSDDKIGKGARATDSDMATLGSVTNDPGDVTCHGVSIVVEDEWDSLEALRSTESPLSPIKGPSEGRGGSSILEEIVSSLTGVKATMHERGTWPSTDHP